MIISSHRIQSALDEFDIEYPNRANNDVYNFQITPENTEDMKSYINLKSILQDIRIPNQVEANDKSNLLFQHIYV